MTLSFQSFHLFIYLRGWGPSNILQQNIKNQLAKFFYLRKNIIRTIRNHLTLMTEFINSSKNVIDLINNLHFLIINYEIMHKSFAQENYVQFYNDKMKKNDVEHKMFFIDRRYQDHKSSYRDQNRSYMKLRNAFFLKII